MLELVLREDDLSDGVASPDGVSAVAGAPVWGVSDSATGGNPFMETTKGGGRAGFVEASVFAPEFVLDLPLLCDLV